jgi:hypothetical protein
MWDVVRVVKHRPLSQEVFPFAQRVLHCPVHTKPQFSLPTPDVKSLIVALNTINNREHENGSVRYRETDFDSSPDKSVARQDAHRADHARDKEGFYPCLLKIEGVDPSTQIRADRHSEKIVFQIHQKIFS